ncbi:hypothetical protein Purlil1_8629 [Purpureocillium lilacinum]|uniref:Nudix hydrolase domain-containing protein n=1 Tax=Purpureocillium lilacinum TaxID=33203 RepID=A0ABR0BSX8_PURLI|nr:hypothetical protein Purlil1_8629 [Purpureocillium lilacinum]
MTADQDTHTEPKTSSDALQGPESVAAYDISVPDYYRANPDVNALIVGAVVFCGDEILLIQRAAGDFAGLMWEIPGGCCEADKDRTVLAGVARELREETGLHLRSIKRVVDQVDIPDHQKLDFMWRKVTFEVDVEEGRGLAPAERREAITAAVKLEPDEHEDWGWATEDQVKQKKWAKGILDSLLLQHGSILHAFPNEADRAESHHRWQHLDRSQWPGAEVDYGKVKGLGRLMAASETGMRHGRARGAQAQFIDDGDAVASRFLLNPRCTFIVAWWIAGTEAYRPHRYRQGQLPGHPSTSVSALFGGHEPVHAHPPRNTRCRQCMPGLYKGLRAVSMPCTQLETRSNSARRNVEERSQTPQACRPSDPVSPSRSLRRATPGVCRAGISRRPGAQQVDGIPALNPAALADGTLPNLRPGQVQRVQGLTSSSASPSSHSGRRATPSQAPQRIVQAPFVYLPHHFQRRESFNVRLRRAPELLSPRAPFSLPSSSIWLASPRPWAPGHPPPSALPSLRAKRNDLKALAVLNPPKPRPERLAATIASCSP